MPANKSLPQLSAGKPTEYRNTSGVSCDVERSEPLAGHSQKERLSFVVIADAGRDGNFAIKGGLTMLTCSSQVDGSEMLGFFLVPFKRLF